jgi:hypothetical protein
VGEKALVDGMMEDSFKLASQLDADGYSPTFLCWFFYEDADDWRLLLGSPVFDQMLPKEEARAYEAVSKAIYESEVRQLSISLIKLIKTSDPLPDGVMRLVGTDKSNNQIHLSSSTLNGIFVQEMVVIRAVKDGA